MKTKEIRKLNNGKLDQLLKDLTFELIKVRSTGTLDDKKAKTKGVANRKEKTSMQKQLRRNIAQIKTIIREREIAQNI